MKRFAPISDSAEIEPDRSNEVTIAPAQVEDKKWISWADAAAIFYEKVSEDNSLNSAKLIFEMESQAQAQNGPSWALRRYIFDHGPGSKLKIRGRVKGGSNLLEVPPVSDDEVDQWIWDSDVTKEDGMQPDELRLPSGQELVSLEVRADSVEELAQHVKAGN